MRAISFWIFLMLGGVFGNVEKTWAETPTVILVDKKTNQLHVAHYHPDKYEIVKTFRATVGKVQGDKEEEADLKTPEGIYHLKTKLLPPQIKPKFGCMAFYLNYPNSYDQIAGRTGFDIMLHGTNEPERLKKDYDSEGCVVLHNEELTQVAPYIRLNLTPILVFAELTEDLKKPTGDPKLIQFMEKWTQSWETKSIDVYIENYHSLFSAQGMNRDAWKKFKASLNSKYATINLKPENIQYFRHPKYSVIQFIQNYSSTLKGGGKGHRSRGTKVLFVAEEDGKLKIISENFTNSIWAP